jgi:hypothetical protein
MIAFIDGHRSIYGVEPICKVLPIAPSTYHAHVAQRSDPARTSARAQRDAALCVEIRRVFDANFRVYGVRKVWRQLGREGIAVARCTVARLMRRMGLRGAVRGRTTRTTIPDRAAPCPLDRVQRQFKAPRPNRLWVSDFTYVATWQGFAYVAFVIDAVASSAGGFRPRPMPGSCWMRWSRRCTNGARSRAAGSCTIRTVRRSRPVPGWPDPHSDGPFGRLAPQGVPVRPDPHSDRPTVSFPGPVGPLRWPFHRLRRRNLLASSAQERPAVRFCLADACDPRRA